MAGLEDFYPELKQRYQVEDRPLSAASPRRLPKGGVPTLIEKPPRLVAEEKKDTQNDEMDNYSAIALGSVGLLLQNLGTHPFIVFRRQCQVSSDSFRRHRTPLTIVPVMWSVQRVQGLSSFWKGLGSALTVKGIVLGMEDLTGKLTPWPREIDSTSSPKIHRV